MMLLSPSCIDTRRASSSRSRTLSFAKLLDQHRLRGTTLKVTACAVPNRIFSMYMSARPAEKTQQSLSSVEAY
jgi:hypothetical protein